MNKKIIYLTVAIFALFSVMVKAQTYSPKVSKDSLAILNARLDALKASLKVQELKIKESEEEADVEKLRIKLLVANGNAKESATKNSEVSEKIKSGTQDAKAVEKMAKKAKSDMADAQKALERYNKQIERVAELRTEIQTEERKLSYKKPIIIYDYK